MKEKFFYLIILYNILVSLFIISFCTVLIIFVGEKTSFRIYKFNNLLFYNLFSLTFLIHKKKILIFLLFLSIFTFAFLYLIYRCGIILNYDDWIKCPNSI